MSEQMDRAVINMPFEMAMADYLARWQFYSRAQSLLAERDQLRAENERLKQELAARHPFRPADPAPVLGHTGCVVCGAFTDHGGLQCPKLRPYSVSQEGNSHA